MAIPASLYFAFAATLPTQATRDPAPGLTIYNQGFAVVRQIVPLDLKPGSNDVRFTDTTAHVEPDSVILRDPAGKRQLRILEQNYLGDPLSQALLLAQYEGKTLDFLVERQGQPPETVQARVIRAPYVIHAAGVRRFGQEYQVRQSARAYGDWTQQNTPIVEMSGKLRFSLPGQPLFPTLPDDAILKPTLHWILDSDAPGQLNAELAYVTGGLAWEADYNVVAPPESEKLDIVGWVTMDNQSGKTFENARIKLMAGDVRKLRYAEEYAGPSRARATAFEYQAPNVTEQAFEDFHLYTLERPSTLRDRESKQVEFLRATGVTSQRIYVYDGAKIDVPQYQNYSMENIRNNAEYGTQSNPKVWIMREFVNSKTHGLGMPLPRGRLRFYRQGDQGALEFVGESLIDHTPADEKVRVYTGNAFDLVGERRRTNFRRDDARNEIQESFEIKLRNHKREPMTIRVVEHLYRWYTWDIAQRSMPFEKIDAQTIEFRVNVIPGEESTISYVVRYSW
jgi:hypothetical protein